MVTVAIAWRSVRLSRKAIRRTNPLGWPLPAIAHMMKKETARLNGRNPSVP